MNDHEYRPYERASATRIARTRLPWCGRFKAHGARVVQGSAGCVGKNAGVGQKFIPERSPT